MGVNERQIQSHEGGSNLQDSVIKQDGFDFVFNGAKCSECGGKCCYGESGYIFVSIHEMEQISLFLQMTFEDFCLQYIKKVGMKFSLVEKICDDKSMGVGCVFFDEKRLVCSIYEVRPKQCRTFPFWNSYKSEKNELAKRCIGVIFHDNVELGGFNENK